MLADHVWTVVFMVGLLGCSSFFSGTETALFSLNRDAVRRLQQKSHAATCLLLILKDNPSGLLIALLFGNLVVNILFFSSSVMLAYELSSSYETWSDALFGFVVLLVVVLFGEIFPKAIGISFPEKIVRVNAFVVRAWYHFIYPIRRVLRLLADLLDPGEREGGALRVEELKLLIDSTRHDRSFGHQEKAIVEEIVHLPEVRLREVMVHRVDQLLLGADRQVDDVLEEMVEDRLELAPVYREDEDDIIGVASVRQLFEARGRDRLVGEFVQPVFFVPETKRADEMLRQFLEEDLRMVCVVDEYGGLAGTLYLEDLLEELVGEFDAMEVPEVEQLSESTYRLGGQLSIREWRTLFVGFASDEVVRSLVLDTVSGLVISLLKRMPKAGDVVHMRNLKFTVEQVRANRIESVLLELDLGEGAA